jgi:hypothetical protein
MVHWKYFTKEHLQYLVNKYGKIFGIYISIQTFNSLDLFIGEEIFHIDTNYAVKGIVNLKFNCLKSKYFKFKIQM